MRMRPDAVLQAVTQALDFLVITTKGPAQNRTIVNLLWMIQYPFLIIFV